MNIEPYLVASSIQLSINQRLVRRICENCREEVQTDLQALRSFGFAADEAYSLKMYRGMGCPSCNKTGFKERTGLFEVLVVDEQIKNAIIEGKSASEVNRLIIKTGVKTLRDAGMQKIREGITTIEEVSRALRKFFDTLRF